MVKNMFPFGLVGPGGKPEHELDLASLDMRHTIHEVGATRDALATLTACIRQTVSIAPALNRLPPCAAFLWARLIRHALD